MDYTKIDFTKFDVTKMLDADAALDQMQNNARTALGYVTDARSRDMAQSIVDASIAFSRAQIQATQQFVQAMKSAIAIR
jgi:hypothetical protein